MSPVVAAPPPPPAAALVTLRPGVPAAALGARRGMPGVAAVESDRLRKAAQQGDPLRASQSHLQSIGWTPPRGRRRPLVAVLDTGVDARAPDLAGVVDARRSRSFVPGSRDPLVDREGHGTHVAGIVAAVTGNGIGGSGVAAARVLAVKIADTSGRATTSSLVRGIHYARARGARVINLSFGGRGRSALEQEAIDAARRAGVLIVAAAGNGGPRARREYPGAYRGVLAVGALDLDGGPLPSSTRGPQVAIAAPGREIRSVARVQDGLPPGELVSRTGTSMATAMVSGAAARILAERPALSPDQVRQLLVSSARDVAPLGRDASTGAGALDLAAALARRAPPRDDAEPNDDPPLARRTRALLPPSRALGRARGRVGGASDPRDGFRVALREGDRLEARLTGPRDADLDLALWRPRTPGGPRGAAFARRWLAGAALGPTSREVLRATARVSGVHILEVQGARGGGRYRLVARVLSNDVSAPP